LSELASVGSTAARAPAYRHIESLLAAGRCVILDGGVETEVQRLAGRDPDPSLWGTGALYQTPETVLNVHRGHIAAGCNIVSTATWSILSAPEAEQDARLTGDDPSHWIDVARLGIQLARKATIESGREGECAVAFAISEEINSPRRRETIELLRRMFADDPPDMLLLETLTLVREPQTYEMVQLLLETGLPVWLSYRRCRHGVCGVYGQHWGPPEGDLFGRAARRFEEMGVEALLINCLPVDHVPGMLGWLRDYTSLPLGVYPNLGHLAGPRWRFDETIGPEAYAELARGWRAEGAQIVGGCCGVTCDHIAALAPALEGTEPGRRQPPAGDLLERLEPAPRRTLPEPWLDERGVDMFPLPLPKLSFESGVFVPTHGSFLVWKHLFRTGLGRDARCLDMGCGSGILSVQLALNGASHVRAIDIDRNAVANTISNAYRNGVGDRVSGEDIDLYQWLPEDEYDLIVASLFQMPVDPYEEPSGHRPLDYWGRNMIDNFIGKLPGLLAPGGRALIMQLSIVGQAATSQRLARDGLVSRVVDFTFFPFGPLFAENKAQIQRVEQLSDAYHLELGGDDVMVAYLIEVSRAADISHSDNGA
jgi:S-methylmethionine-dependent homocysteine/selenocysteine methylase/SAM-dependent methyltransferase